MGIKVKATRMGYYGHLRRRPGDVFELEDIETTKNGKRVVIKAETFFSQNWMVKVEGKTPAKVSTSQQAINDASADIKSGRTPGAPVSSEEVI